MNKQELRDALSTREDVLTKRYNMYCKGVNEKGNELSYKAAANARTYAKKELELCKLVTNLIDLIPEAGIKRITYENINTLYALIEPTERHRRLYEKL